MVKRILLTIGFLAVVAALPCESARAQCAGTGGPPGLNKGLCIYSVKFVCGLQQPDPSLQPPLETPVKPGNYATAVNIHNFHNNQPVTIAKKAVIANPEGQPPGQISSFQRFPLGPDGAFEIDCCDIVRLLLGVPSDVPCQQLPTKLPPFIKGFVEVISPVTLSVTGVYTAEFCAPSPTQACAPGPVSIDVVPEEPFAGP
ncbi:MAG TPA: hypothetical protein VIX59_09850 [Candidatus Binataceae bacterium]